MTGAVRGARLTTGMYNMHLGSSCLAFMLEAQTFNMLVIEPNYCSFLCLHAFRSETGGISRPGQDTPRRSPRLT